MTREERKAARLAAIEKKKQDRIQERADIKAWNWMIRKAERKGALIEQTISTNTKIN